MSILHTRQNMGTCKKDPIFTSLRKINEEILPPPVEKGYLEHQTTIVKLGADMGLGNQEVLQQ
jgi:hypothetical protein